MADPLDSTSTAPSAKLPPGLSRRAFLMGTAACAGGLLLGRDPARADILDTLKKFIYLDPIMHSTNLHRARSLYLSVLATIHRDAAGKQSKAIAGAGVSQENPCPESAVLRSLSFLSS